MQLDPHTVTLRINGDWSKTELGPPVLSSLATALCLGLSGTGSFIRLQGLSGVGSRNFLNALISLLPHPRYLELGVGAGSMFAAAIDGREVTAAGVDDYSENPDDLARFRENVDRVNTESAKIDMYRTSFDRLNLGDLTDFNVLFYDGPVDHARIFDTISSILRCLSDTAICIIDDWNSPEARFGYKRLKDAGFIHEISSVEIRTTLDNTHPEIFGESSVWHNGIMIAIIHQNRKSLQTNRPSSRTEEIIEESIDLSKSTSVTVDDEFPNSKFFAPRVRTGEYRRYTLRDVVCDFGTMATYQAGELFKPTAYLMSEEEMTRQAPAGARIIAWTPLKTGSETAF